MNIALMVPNRSARATRRFWTAVADHASAEIDAMIAGKNAATTNYLFSNTTEKWSSNTYVPNTDLWCQSLRSQLTGIHMGAGAWKQSYGLVAITPQHAISVGHNGPYGNVNEQVKYVNTDGTVHTATVQRWACDNVSQASKVNVPQIPSAGVADLSVYRFASELPSWVAKARIVDLTAGRSIMSAHDPYMPFLAISQGNWGLTDNPAYPTSLTLHNRKVYVKNGLKSTPYMVPLPGDREAFRHDVQVGDSGCPGYILVGGLLYLVEVQTSYAGTAQPIGPFIDYVNSLIARADAAQGVPNVYQVALSEIEIPN